MKSIIIPQNIPINIFIIRILNIKLISTLCDNKTGNISSLVDK